MQIDFFQHVRACTLKKLTLCAYMLFFSTTRRARARLYVSLCIYYTSLSAQMSILLYTLFDSKLVGW